MEYRHTYVEIDKILSNLISQIKINQVGNDKELVLAVNYQEHIYQIEALIKEEVKKTIDKNKRNIFKKKHSN